MYVANQLGVNIPQDASHAKGRVAHAEQARAPNALGGSREIQPTPLPQGRGTTYISKPLLLLPLARAPVPHWQQTRPSLLAVFRGDRSMTPTRCRETRVCQWYQIGRAHV